MYAGYTADEARQAAMWALMQKHAEERAKAKQEAQLSNISPNTQYAGVVAHEG